MALLADDVWHQITKYLPRRDLEHLADADPQLEPIAMYRIFRRIVICDVLPINDFEYLETNGYWSVVRRLLVSKLSVEDLESLVARYLPKMTGLVSLMIDNELVSETGINMLNATLPSLTSIQDLDVDLPCPLQAFPPNLCSLEVASIGRISEGWTNWNLPSLEHLHTLKLDGFDLYCDVQQVLYAPKPTLSALVLSPDKFPSLRSVEFVEIKIPQVNKFVPESLMIYELSVIEVEVDSVPNFCSRLAEYATEIDLYYLETIGSTSTSTPSVVALDRAEKLTITDPFQSHYIFSTAPQSLNITVSDFQGGPLAASPTGKLPGVNKAREVVINDSSLHVAEELIRELASSSHLEYLEIDRSMVTPSLWRMISRLETVRFLVVQLPSKSEDLSFKEIARYMPPKLRTLKVLKTKISWSELTRFARVLQRTFKQTRSTWPDLTVYWNNKGREIRVDGVSCVPKSLARIGPRWKHST